MSILKVIAQATGLKRKQAAVIVTKKLLVTTDSKGKTLYWDLDPKHNVITKSVLVKQPLTHVLVAVDTFEL